MEYGFKHKLGTRLGDTKQKAMNPRTFFNLETEHKNIPESYDFREDPEVKEYLRVNPIRDQGDCAASWAFSTIGNIFLVLKNFFINYFYFF